MSDEPEGYEPPSLFDDEAARHDEAHRDAAPERVDEVITRKRRTRFASCAVALLFVAALGAGAVVLIFSGADKLRDLFAGPEDYSGSGSGSVVFEVEAGDTSREIGSNLEEAGVVASTEAFTDAAAENPDATSIQVGFYALKKKMSAEAALDVLVDPDNLVQNTVTIPEGLRVEDTIKVLAQKTDVPRKQFERVLDRPRSIGLPAYSRGNAEGYLFPATYAFPPNASATEMLTAMVDRWREAADAAKLEERAKELGYTPAELMTIASLVESEANRDEDRGKVARVIYNRLETDVTNRLLQIDATVNYALGRDLGLGLTAEQLQVDSPYNTRRYPGLPPGPIESPGDKAIEAAANPTEGDWVYYVTVNLDTGETKFTDDYQEFLRFKNVDLAEFCAGSDRC